MLPAPRRAVLATQVVQFLKKKQVEDTLFFFSFDANDDNKVRNIFWAYGKSMVAYEQYCDVVSFDTRYEINLHNQICSFCVYK